jgi:hypothetical protein
MKIYTLEALEMYLVELLTRMKKSGKATQNDIDMTGYNLDVVRSRIKDKGGEK